MQIGIPREIKPREGRVSLTPEACGTLVRAGHTVFVQQGAGVTAGYTDDAYRQTGATICRDAAAVYAEAGLIVKVKEPLDDDLRWLRSDQLLFCYLHLAAAPQLLQNLLDKGLTAIAFETVQLDDGSLPLLLPMSIIAGRLAGQIGMNLLHASEGGKGILLGGLATTQRGQVVILGAGNAGAQCVDVLASTGANLTVFDLDSRKLAPLHARHANVTTLPPSHAHISAAVAQADLLVGAVLVTGSRAPILVDRAMIKTMQPGSVVIDIAVDQGGCIETIRPTSYDAPTYLVDDIIHFAVTNMPGTVPRTASEALSAAILPYVMQLADGHLQASTPLTKGINVAGGKIIHPALQTI